MEPSIEKMDTPVLPESSATSPETKTRAYIVLGVLGIFYAVGF